MRPILDRLLASVLITGMLASPVFVTSAFAQPAPDKKDDKKDDKNPADDADKMYSCNKKSGPIAVTFKPETELKDLITWVMGFTCKNFILDPRIVSTGKKVTIIAPLKMSPSEAYDVFLAALSTMALTVVPKGNVMRIVDANVAKSETIPIMRKGVPADQDQMVRYVLKPSYAQVETIRQALDAIRSQAGNVAAAGNLLIITDYSSQIRDMLTLAKALDVPGNNEGIYTIPVLHADAQQLATKVNDVLGLGAAGSAAGGGPRPGQPAPTPPAPGQHPGGSSTTSDVSVAVPSKILVDERTNTMIVVSSEAGYVRVKGLVDRLDIALDTEGGSALHVYPLENALAEELATVLNNAMTGQQAKTGAQAGGRPAQEACGRSCFRAGCARACGNSASFARAWRTVHPDQERRQQQKASSS